jgi:hypothetical protein
MPRFIKELRGTSDQVIEHRFEPVLEAIDAGRAVFLGRAAAIERTHLRGAQREQARLAYKYGKESAQVEAVSQRVRTTELRLAALKIEMQRGTAAVVTPNADSVVIHGLVLGADRTAQSKLTVAIVSSAGRAIARAKTDESGYFRLDTKPVVGVSSDTSASVSQLSPDAPATTRKAKTGPAIAPRRPSRLVVLEGKREVYSEDLETLDAGRSRYRELVLRAAR